MTGRRLVGLALAPALLSACATTPAPAPARSNAREALLSVAEQRAQAAEAAGDLDEAIWRWRVAEALEADEPEAGNHAAALEARRAARARALAEPALRAAAGADPARATAELGAALALDPSQDDVRAALRGIDGADELRAVARSGAGGPAAPRPASSRSAPARRAQAAALSRKAPPSPKGAS